MARVNRDVVVALLLLLLCGTFFLESYNIQLTDYGQMDSTVWPRIRSSSSASPGPASWTTTRNGSAAATPPLASANATSIRAYVHRRRSIARHCSKG